MYLIVFTCIFGCTKAIHYEKKIRSTEQKAGLQQDEHRQPEPGGTAKPGRRRYNGYPEYLRVNGMPEFARCKLLRFMSVAGL